MRSAVNILSLASRSVITVAPTHSIDKAISLMEEHEIHHVVVAEEERPVGIISDRDILISTGWMLGVERRAQNGDSTGLVVGPTRVEQIMSRPVLGLSESDSPRDAALLMDQRKISAAPVLREGRLLGIVTETDLVRWLDKSAAEGLLDGEVRDLMHAYVLTVRPGDPLSNVIHLFRRYHVRHVPVAVQKTLLGIISDRDVRRALGWSSIRDMQAEVESRLTGAEPATARAIMHRSVETIPSFAPLREALRRMLELRIHSLPVVDADELVGILTRTDFVQAVAREELIGTRAG
jgi:CBS domain-containing protein